MRVAPDVERLMWLVAESADSQAVADFESRFPDLKYELSKRIDMVRELKASRRIGEGPASIPQFSRPTPMPSGGVRRWQLAAGLAALSALAFGSFYIARQYAHPTETGRPVAVAPPERTVETPLRVPKVQYGERPDPNLTAPPVQDPESLVEVPVLSAWDKPQEVHFQKIHLVDALRAIAAQAGLQLQIAPGMPNPEIQAEYRGRSGLEILADMGPRFGFTAFHQGDGVVIVIPARDESGDHAEPGAEREGNPRNDGRLSEPGLPDR